MVIRKTQNAKPYTLKGPHTSQRAYSLTLGADQLQLGGVGFRVEVKHELQSTQDFSFSSLNRFMKTEVNFLRSNPVKLQKTSWLLFIFSCLEDKSLRRFSYPGMKETPAVLRKKLE